MPRDFRYNYFYNQNITIFLINILNIVYLKINLWWWRNIETEYNDTIQIYFSTYIYWIKNTMYIKNKNNWSIYLEKRPWLTKENKYTKVQILKITSGPKRHGFKEMAFQKNELKRIRHGKRTDSVQFFHYQTTMK